MPLYHKLTEAEKQLIGDIHCRTFHLLPCRHSGCGSRRLYAGRHHQESYVVKCLDCECQTFEFRTLEEALENWGVEPPLTRPPFSTAAPASNWQPVLASD